MRDIYLNLLMVAISCAINIYTCSGLVLFLGKHFPFPAKALQLAQPLWKYTKLPTLIGTFALPVLIVIVDGHATWHTYFEFAVNLWTYYVLRNEGDDDFTKKLKRKLKEKVEVLRGKLVVVPEAA